MWKGQFVMDAVIAVSDKADLGYPALQCNIK